MTKPSRRSSLLQTRDPHSHSFFHRFRHNSLHAHHQNHQPPHNDANDIDVGKELGVNDELDSSSLVVGKRDPSTITEKVVINAVDGGQGSLITQVVQTISLFQYVDPWGSVFETKTVYATPNTVVVDPKTGKTVAISLGAQSSVALPGSTPGGSGHASSSPGSTISTSLGPKLTPAPSSATAKPVYPSVADIRNSTNSVFHGNSSFVATVNNSSSIYKVFSGPVSLSSTRSSTTSKTKSTSKSAHSTPSTSFSPTTTTSPIKGYGTLTVVGGLPTTQPEPGSNSGINLTTQQKQVIGGVVGAVAGVAVIGLLLMLLLRYKKQHGSRIMLDPQSAAGAGGSRAIGDGMSGGGGSGESMAERSAAAGAVAAALTALSGKRAPPTEHSTEKVERGFYRVSGRKLPSVLHSGGDGYSDPRGSATSGSSDYYRGSQAFEPAPTSGGQLTLGAPMRPVSGIPIIRSGPARVAITENPFADPPTTPTLSSRTLGSRESPRASGSRFQERI